MADYVDTKLPDNLTQEQLGKRIQRIIADPDMHSVEVLRSDNTFVLRAWFTSAYNLSDHTDLGVPT
jgi:hypothetical protein